MINYKSIIQYVTTNAPHRNRGKNKKLHKVGLAWHAHIVSLDMNGDHANVKVSIQSVYHKFMENDWKDWHGKMDK